MAESLREQLLKSGIVKQTRKSAPPRRKNDRRGKPPHQRASSESSDRGEMNLAHAWALRGKAENEERRQAQARAEAEARERKERKRKLRQALAGKALNQPEAERARHFEYSGKIRRVYVDDAQWKALNAGQLGVVQSSGSYVLVTREVAEQVQAFAPGHVALLLDPGTDTADDGIPDDLTW